MIPLEVAIAMINNNKNMKNNLNKKILKDSEKHVSRPTSNGMKKFLLYTLISVIIFNFFLPFVFSLNNNLGEIKKAEAVDDCVITSAVWEPSGEQVDNFYKEKVTTANINVVSKNCVGVTGINLTIYESDGLTTITDDVWDKSGLDDREISIPTDKFAINMLLGEEDCETKLGGGIGFDCDLYFKIKNGTDVIYSSVNTGSSGDGAGGSTPGWLWYGCEGLGCDENGQLLGILPLGNNSDPVNFDALTPINLDNSYTLLAPIGDLKKAPADMGDYFRIIFELAIALCAVLAVVMIVIGGVQYMGNESIFGKTEAKSKIMAAIGGLLIALGAYALLNTINPDLLGGGVSIKQVTAEIDMDVHGDAPQASSVGGKYCNGRVVDGAEVDTITGRRWDNDSTERSALSTVGITIQRPNSCTKVGQKNCTSLTGLNTSKVINFKNKCTNCAVVINGATECWNHSPKTEHYPGNTIVDIDDTPTVDAYIKTGTKTRDSKNKYDIYEKDGMRFLDEGNHYHVISW